MYEDTYPLRFSIQEKQIWQIYVRVLYEYNWNCFYAPMYNENNKKINEKIVYTACVFDTIYTRNYICMNTLKWTPPK